MGIQTKRQMEFHCEFNDKLSPEKEEEGKALMARRLVGEERLSGAFQYTLTLHSEDRDIDAEELLGKYGTLEVRYGLEKPRYFDGIVTEFSYGGESGEGYASYTAVLRPWLWLLSRNRQSRVYQQKTAVEIAMEIFERYGFKPLVETRQFYGLLPLEHCVQYSESDFDFVNRILEREGIYYFFEHRNIGRGQAGHILILADNKNAHDTRPSFERIAVGKLLDPDNRALGKFETWNATKHVVPGKITLNDYDFTKSRTDLRYDRSDSNDHAYANAEVYVFPGGYSDPGDGANKTVVRLEEAMASYAIARGKTDCVGLAVGTLFTLEGHERKQENGQYLIVGATYDADGGPFDSGRKSPQRMSMNVAALSAETQFRPSRSTPIPFLAGPQVAKVVGPAGREIWADEHGRVKIQFAWDRFGKHDETSSCFVRVSQAWAGGALGAQFLPRIGDEVIVSFIDGDIDRPIITGRVYNDANRLPFHRTPDFLTRSGIRSQTFEGSLQTYNELSFRDEKGNEQLYLQAQRNMDTLVKQAQTLKVGSNRTKTIGGKETNQIDAGRQTTVAKFDNLTVTNANKNTTVHGQFNIVADEHFKVQQKSTQLYMSDRVYIQSDGDIDIKNGQTRIVGEKSGDLLITANGKVTVKCGSSSVTLSEGVVTINGTMIKLNSP